MPWTAHDHPPALDSLAPAVRRRALEQANALLAAGYGEIRALSMAIARARRGDGAADPRASDLTVRHDGVGWLIQPEGADEPSHVFAARDDALRRAQELAREWHTACFVLSAEGGLMETFDFRDEDERGEDEPAAPEPSGPPRFRLAKGDGGWELTREGAADPVGVWRSKRTGLKHAREVAAAAGGVLLVCYADGRVQQRLDFEG